jgi:hypothetical protein
VLSPEDFAEWIGYSVEELLNGAAETGSDISQSDNESKSKDGDDTSDSSGLLSRLFGG